MIRITIFLLLLSFGVSAQDFPQKVVGKQQFTDSVQFKKFKNNSAMDSVLITDTSGKLRLKKVSTGWGLAGNPSTSPSTNFIGTTDNIGLKFKANNVQSGYIDLLGANTSFGYNALASNNVSNNSAFGVNSLENNLGSNNSGFGETSLRYNSGDYNSGFGGESLGLNSDGAFNIGIGYKSGLYNTTQSNRLYINSLDRDDILGDTTKSIIYGYQDATAANQRLYLNSQVYMPYLTTAAGTKALRWNPSTGLVSAADTTTGGGGGISGSGTTDYIPKWSSSSALGNSPLFDSSGYIGLNTIHPLAMLHVGSGTVNNSSDAAVLVSRSLTGAGSSHAFADATNFAKNVGTAYNSFDARNTIGGAVNYDHYVGFQSVPIYSSSGTMTNLYGSYFKPVVNSGTITNNYGYYAANMDAISGTVTNNYGLYVEPLTRGGTNYAIYTSGSSLVYLGGAITANSSATVAGQINANSVGGNIRFKADGTTGKDGTILASSGGDLYFSNWDLTKGIKVANSGDINTIGSGSFTSTGAFISAGTLNANSVGTNLRFKADGTTAKDGGFFANSGGDIFLSNWDANRGFKIVSTGEIQTLSSTMNFAGATSSYPSLVVSSGSLLLKDAAGTTSAGLGVGVSSVMDGSAKLQVNATDKGFLPPRMTATQGSAISSPAEGLLIYVTNTNGTFTAKGWWGYDGAAWQKLN